MTKTLLTILALAFALVTLPAAARAADGPGTKAVRSANDTIAKSLKQKTKPGSPEEKAAAEKVTVSVRSFLDIDELGKRALVDQWAKLTEAQKTEFLTLLRELIEDNYIKGLRANLEYQVAYKGEGPGPDKTIIVNTEVTAKKKGRPIKIKVDYVLVDVGGKMKCFDVKTDGVGLVDNYRAQFNKIIAKDGFDGLLTKMKKKRATK
jgi:phospholipid transport system substrate-binding protein